jgi:hypothetical protein
VYSALYSAQYTLQYIVYSILYSAQYRVQYILYRTLYSAQCTVHYLHYSILYRSGRDSSVGIATRKGMGVPEIESLWRRDFPHPSIPALGRTLPPVKWVPGVSRGYFGRGVMPTPHPIFSAEVLNRVELYLYLP